MVRYVFRGLGVIAAAAALALTAAPPAEATITLQDCTITPLTPAPPFLGANGQKLSAGRASVRCATQRYVQVRLALWGEDPFFDFDDPLGATFVADSVGPTVKIFGAPNPFHPEGRPCNEDSPGADELFTRVAARITTPDTPFSSLVGWTPPTPSPGGSEGRRSRTTADQGPAAPSKPLCLDFPSASAT
jgi:hypothetical protein